MVLSSCNNLNEPEGPIIPTDPLLIIDSDPAWSPDGKTIVYFHLDSTYGKIGLYLIDTSGSNKILLLNGYFGSPCWSPDGTWIVFSNFANKQIYKIKKDGTGLTQLTKTGNNFYPSWSKDNKWIIFDSDLWSPSGLNHILRMNTSGNEKHILASNLQVGELRAPSFSNDSKYIIHQRAIQSNMGSELFIMDSSGMNERRISNNEGFEYYPRYSPDNKLILFTYIYLGEVNTRVCVIDTSGNGFRALINFYSQSGDWSPDGKYIVFTDARKSSGRLWIMDTNGTIIKQLTFD